MCMKCTDQKFFLTYCLMKQCLYGLCVKHAPLHGMASLRNPGLHLDVVHQMLLYVAKYNNRQKSRNEAMNCNFGFTV